MKRGKLSCISLLCMLMLFILAMPASAATGVNVTLHSQEDILNYIQVNGTTVSEPITFAQEPVLTAPYVAGALSADTLNTAVKMIN